MRIKKFGDVKCKRSVYRHARVYLQSDIANSWPGMHHTAFQSFLKIGVNRDHFDNAVVWMQN